MIASKWSVPDSKILKRGEIGRVLGELHRKSSRSVNTRQTLIVFRLTCCCGLRVSEACGLRLRDVRVNVDRPYLRIPKSEAKGKKTKTVNGRKVKVGNGATARQIPLWWDQGTLDDLRAWKREREQQGASASDYFVCAQQNGTRGKRLDRRNARNRFIVACRALGPARAAEITIHHGRHSFISHALAGGRSLAEVAAAAGHANITITAIYTHVAVDDDGRIGSLFSFSPNGNGDPRP